MSRKLVRTDEAWEGYLFWQSQDKKTLKKINKILVDTKRQPSMACESQKPCEKTCQGFGLGELITRIV